MRTIIVLLIVIILFAFAFSDNSVKSDKEDNQTVSQNTSQIEKPNRTQEIEKIEIQQKIKDDLDNYRSETLLPIEELYKNEDVYKKAKATQGLIEDITVNGTSPMILVGKNVYEVDSETFLPAYKVEESVTTLSFYNSMQAGNQLLINTSENLYTSIGKDGELFFKDLVLNENECIYSILNGGLTTITIPQKGNIKVKYYNIADDASVKLSETVTVWQYELNNNKNIKIKNTISTNADIGTGYYIYCISNGNGLYRATGCMRLSSALLMETSEAIANNVENVYAPATIGFFTTCPVYSEIQNDKMVFTNVAGKDLANSEDDVKISFELPENYTTKNIKNVFGCGNALLFEFDDKSIFASEQIDQTSSKSYKLEHMTELTLLNQEGVIKKICGTNSAENHIYILLTNNKLYFSQIA